MALTRNEIKFIKSLQEKKVREQERLFVVEGVKLVEELLLQDALEVEAVYSTAEFILKTTKNLKVVPISESDLERISGLVNPNKVLALVKFPQPKNIDWQLEKNVLVLDEIKDPGNLGTILRTADWFGINTIIASENCVDLFNPKVIQSSMGAVYRINYIQNSLQKLLPDLKKSGFKLVGAAMQGKELYAYSYPEKLALVMGSESHGISEKTNALLDETITIPKFGETESLNVGVAAAIILSHFRQVKGI
jgi:TrmH family RNA methyltransferase